MHLTFETKGLLVDDQFLNLLMAQLKNQDPLDAPDVNKLSEQITSFSQLEQLMNLNNSMEGMAKFQGGQERSQAVSLIGKTVQVTDDSLRINGNDKGNINMKLADSAEEVKVIVTDSLGRVVRTVEYANVPEGNSSFDFDGFNEEGQPLGNGDYSITVEARKENGVKVGVSSLDEGVVSDVSFGLDGTVLSVNGKSYRIDQILNVKGTVTPVVPEEEV